MTAFSGNTSNLTSLNDLISPIVTEAMFVASEQSIMPGLVKQFTVPANSGKVLQVPLYGNQSAVNLTEGTDIVGTSGDVTVSTGVANITLSEAGIMTLVTDMSLNHATSNVVADLGKVFGEAIAKKHDQALTAKFSSFTSSIGADQDEIEVKDLFEAYATLKSAAVPGPYYGVFHPKAIYNLKKQLTNTFTNPSNALAVTNQAMSEGYIGRIAGIDIFETSNVVEDSATAVTNAVFSRDALGIAIASDLKVATQRDESMRGSEVIATSVFGVNVLHNTYGVKILGDNQIN
jgi:N4-gp56 family major capsid protein